MSVYSTPSIFTDRLELRPAPRKALLADLVGHAALSAALGVDVPASWPPEFYDADAINYTLAQIGEHDDGGPWSFHYLILLPTERAGPRRATLIGSGGWKDEPTEDGEAELGYGLVPEHQGRGYATEAVRAWVERAFSDPRIRRVIGQTLPRLNASIGVLVRAGFTFDGAGNDQYAPPDEQVIRYVLTREAFDAQRAT